MEIRRSERLDVTALQELNAIELGYELPLPQTKKYLDEILNDSTQTIIVAVENEIICGYVHGQIYQTLYFEPLVNVLGLAELSKKQHLGIGRALMFELEKWAEAKGACGIRLNSGEERVDAHLFYEKMGYLKTKRQYNFKKIF